MKSTFALVIATLFAFISAHTTKYFASCPKYESNMSFERFNQTAFGGLWFEYLYDGDFKENSKYECASWNLLSHSEGQYYLLHNSQNRSTGLYAMVQHKMTCGKPYTPESQTCNLKTQDSPTVIHDYTLTRPRNLQIIDTDMYSYAVMSACYDYGAAHQEDFVVITRTKEPSMMTKKSILNALSKTLGMSDEKITSLEKGNVRDCWGEDHHL